MRFHLAPLSLILSDLERSIQVTQVFNGLYISKSVQDNHRVTIDDGYSAASRNFEKGARSRTHFQKAGQPEYFWATHPFNAKHPFNIYLCITILQEAFISTVL